MAATQLTTPTPATAYGPSGSPTTGQGTVYVLVYRQAYDLYGKVVPPPSTADLYTDAYRDTY